MTIPPMTTVASGRWISLPTPVAMAIGMNPAISVIAVASTGWRRVFEAAMIAIAPCRSVRSASRIAVIRICPLRTAIPVRAINPPRH